MPRSMYYVLEAPALGGFCLSNPIILSAAKE